jgi:hypothetical protein
MDKYGWLYFKVVFSFNPINDYSGFKWSTAVAKLIEHPTKGAYTINSITRIIRGVAATL